MTDRDHELLSRFLDGELTSAQEEEVAKKLMASPEYREELEKLKALHSLAQEAYPAQEFRYKKPAKRRLPRLVPLAAALALTCILVGVGYAALSGALFDQSDAPEETVVIESSTVALEPESTDTTEPSSSAELQADETVSVEEVEQPTTTVAASASRIVTGTVHDYDGQPIRDARITTPDLTANTDASGAFSIPFPADYSYDVEVARRGYSSVRFRIQPYLMDAEFDLKIKLNPKVNIQGRVVDELDRPITGVRVTAYNDIVGTDAAISDRDGRYTLAVSSSDDYALWVKHPEYAAKSGLIQTDGRVADVVLRKGGVLRVSVLEKDAPLEGMRVVVRKLEQELFKELTAYTDAEGFAWFYHLPTDQEYTVKAVKEDGDEENQWVRVAKNQQAECIIQFNSEVVATLAGRVTMEDGSPIADARITVTEDDSPDRWRKANTDDQGRYSVALTPGRNKIAVGTNQNQWKHIVLDVDTSGGEFKRNFRFDVVEPISFQLVHLNGDPKEDVLLRSNFTPYSATNSLQVWAKIPDGIVRLDSWRGTPTLEVFDPTTELINEWRKQEEGQSEEDGTSDLVVLDQPAGVIEGRVVTSSGDPVAGVRLYARTQDSDKAFGVVGSYSDSNGNFRIAPLRAQDDYRIWTQRLGYIGGEDFVKSKPGSEANPVIITMHLPESEVSGRVVFPNGQPVAEAAISLYTDANSNSAFGRADAMGNFKILVRRGTYTIVADALDVSSGEWPVQAPASNIQVVMPYPEGEITDPFHQLRNNYLKQLGLSFKMYANESRGEKFPELSRTVGTFLPTLSQIYPEYAPNQSIIQAMRGEGGFPRMVYFGYAISDAEVANLFLDAYETYGPAEISGSDLAMEPGVIGSGIDSIFQLREGIERFFITDINDPGSSARAQANIPVLWELPDPARESGGWVLYLDGHTEYVEYPGKYPMDESVIERVRGLMQGR